MKAVFFIMVLAAWVLLPPADGEEIRVRVTADRVNLRAAALFTAEVVAQVNEDDELVARTLGDEWVEVLPPAHIDFWVHRDFIQDRLVTSRKLNVRSGPGINFLVVGELTRGDELRVRGEFGEWTQIAPPPNSSLWVSREYVEPLALDVDWEDAPALEPVVREEPFFDRVALEEPEVAVIRPRPRLAPEPDGEEMRTRPRPQLERSRPLPGDWRLIPLEGQGKLVEVEGTLSTVGFMLRKPTRYRLVRAEGRSSEMVCFVHGDEEQLAPLAGERLSLSGREYWVQGYQYPIVVVEQISLSGRRR